MINIVIPMAGKDVYFSKKDYLFSKYLIEINGKTMIEHVIENYSSIKEKRFIFIINKPNSDQHHLDNILKILTDYKCEIIVVEKETMGAACSVMLAIDYINNESNLIIANPDQIFDRKISDIIGKFINYDSGVPVFHSVHPRYSYVRKDENDMVFEVAEKNPISNYAIAGLFFFSEGRAFISSVESMIKKSNHLNGLFFISPCLNEIILRNKTVHALTLDNKEYHTFYTPKKIEEYERL
ncbi:glycosyltransferase family 2 protein [Gammaproteobacteria bacterium]|nr:glycosyltransferase family 2 protein [Gammaproteobacteria bacterium]